MAVLAPQVGVGSVCLLDGQGGMLACGQAVLLGVGRLADAVELQRPLQMQGGQVALPHRPVPCLAAVVGTDVVGRLVQGQGELIEPQLVVTEGNTGVGVLGDHAVLDTVLQL
jgi:hypothetical protein